MEFKKYFSLIFLSFFLCSCNEPTDVEELIPDDVEEKVVIEHDRVAIVIHGGAGAIKKENMPEDLEKRYLAVLDSIVEMGHEALEKGASSIDVVSDVIVAMENIPLFNAGKGAVFTYDEENELDASIMVGSTKEAGAIAGVKRVKNPILLARKVMEESVHVLMSGDGAEHFAKKVGVDMVSPDYFRVDSRIKSLKKVKEREAKSSEESASIYDDELKGEKFGTVGCVALDKNGEIVAGTSTGGMTNKRWGRIGDSPIIGAGTYADNKVCGVSSTGWGEFFIRGVVAFDIAALTDYKEMTIENASHQVIHKKIPEMGGDGGVIVLDPEGNVSMQFNTAGMFRAAIDGKAQKFVAIYE